MGGGWPCLLVGEIRERNTHTHTHIDQKKMQIITGRCLNQCFQVNRNENEKKTNEMDAKEEFCGNKSDGKVT